MVVVGVLWLKRCTGGADADLPERGEQVLVHFWPTMLLAVLTCSSAGYAVVGLVGEERQQEQRLMLVAAALAIVLMVLGSLFDGPNVEHQRFATELLFAAADVFGAMVGAAVAILLFAVVLAVYESQQPAPSGLIRHPRATEPSESNHRPTCRR